MESLGFAIGGLIWGAPAAALAVLVVVAVADGRWRRKAIAALEGGERAADGQYASGRTASTAEEA